MSLFLFLFVTVSQAFSCGRFASAPKPEIESVRAPLARHTRLPCVFDAPTKTSIMQFLPRFGCGVPIPCLLSCLSCL